MHDVGEYGPVIAGLVELGLVDCGLTATKRAFGKRDRLAFRRLFRNESGISKFLCLFGLTFPQFEKFALDSGLVCHIPDTGLDDDGLMVEADDNPVVVDHVVVLEDANASLALHRLFEILIGRQTDV
jgi:hypothetical protein